VRWLEERRIIGKECEENDDDWCVDVPGVCGGGGGGGEGEKGGRGVQGRGVLIRHAALRRFS
jgi:hypothetical protein